MKIYITRHGQTDSNKERRLMGQKINDSLNEVGIKQSEELAKSLLKEEFDIVFSSPLKRALETSEIIKKQLNIPIITDKRLTERDFGSLSGKSWDEIENSSPWTTRENDLAQKYDYSSFGGETAKDVEKRLIDFLEYLKKEYSDKKILIVAHGGIAKLLQHIYRDKEVFTPKNCTVSSFEI